MMSHDSPDPIRVLIAEDQQVIRRAFATMLGLEPDIKVVAQAADGSEAIQLARQWRPDIILMDLQMPRVGGIAAMKTILLEVPGVQVIVLTTFDTDELVFEAISAGAQAYLLKDESEETILDTIRAVRRGESRISANIARKVFNEFRRARPEGLSPTSHREQDGEELSEKEERVLRLIADGRSNKEIADTIFLAEGTVKNYVSRIMEKLHAKSRTELAVKALKRPRP
jgi:DNA-binding NarL/FixJ family response regulator